MLAGVSASACSMRLLIINPCDDIVKHLGTTRYLSMWLTFDAADHFMPRGEFYCDQDHH